MLGGVPSSSVCKNQRFQIGSKNVVEPISVYLVTVLPSTCSMSSNYGEQDTCFSLSGSIGKSSGIRTRQTWELPSTSKVSLYSPGTQFPSGDRTVTVA